MVTKARLALPEELPLGSSAWLEAVFMSGPARNVRGRSRPTQRYMARSLEGAPTVAEGGNAAIARTLLTAAVLAGQIRRFKLEPFALHESIHGVDAVPDILLERNDGRLFVVETKSDRYLTEEKLEKCRAVERVVIEAKMTYLFWTDRWPLSPAVWQLLRELRRCGTSDTPEARIVELEAHLIRRPWRMSELRESGIYRDIVLAAVWQGRAHIDLFAPLSDESVVSNDVRKRNVSQVFSAPVAARTFFRSLARHD